MTTTKTSLPALSPSALHELQAHLDEAVKAPVSMQITPQTVAVLRQHFDDAANHAQMYGALTVPTTEAGFCTLYRQARPMAEIAISFLPWAGPAGVAFAAVLRAFVGLGDKACSS